MVESSFTCLGKVGICRDGDVLLLLVALREYGCWHN